MQNSEANSTNVPEVRTNEHTNGQLEIRRNKENCLHLLYVHIITGLKLKEQKRGPNRNNVLCDSWRSQHRWKSEAKEDHQ